MKVAFLHTLLIIVVCCSSPRLGAQEFVPNNGFEFFTSCPQNLGEIQKAVPWEIPGDHLGTSDYFNKCYSNTSKGPGVPSNNLGFQQAHSGEGYIGLITYHAIQKNYREYITISLTAPLLAGEQYWVRFYYSLAEKSKYATDAFGVYLSTTPVPCGAIDTDLPQNPQITNPIGKFMEDTDSWELFEALYTASGGEQFITMGNFFPDSVKTNLKLVNSENSFAQSYLYIDDVSIQPYFRIEGDTSICSGQSITLAAAGAPSYLWVDALNPNTVISTNQHLTVTPQATTTYLLYNPPYDTLAHTIHVAPLPDIPMEKDTSLCLGSALVLDVSTPGADYLWQDGSGEAIKKITTEGLYWVEVNLNNCISRDTIYVRFVTPPEVELGEDTVLCLGSGIWLNAMVNNPEHIRYSWQNGSGESSFFAARPGTYWVDVTRAGCTVRDLITVESEDCGIELNIPNAFSPNQDGMNEFFTPISYHGVKKSLLTVHNKWGNLIYESPNINFNWDGTYRNNPCEEGVYFWIIQYQDYMGTTYTDQGTVTLFR